MPYPVLIVPGLHGSAGDHWQSRWLADNDDAMLVEQADWSNPNAESWLATLESAVIAHPNALIVAHSLGTIVAARLARSRVASLVAGALLVAPADIERTGSLHGRDYEFGAMPTHRLPFPSLLVASRNDPYMPFDKASEVARAWGSAFRDLGHAGHINIASGYGRWPGGYGLANVVLDDVSQDGRFSASYVSQ